MLHVRVAPGQPLPASCCGAPAPPTGAAPASLPAAAAASPGRAAALRHGLAAAAVEWLPVMMATAAAIVAALAALTWRTLFMVQAEVE